MISDTILIVEDNDSQRLALHTALEMRGFSVESAGSVESARALVNKLGDKLGVMILDMRLEDRQYPSITGADLGLEVRASRPAWRPEFLITSAFSEVDYYRLAVELGVAAYLHKEEHTQNQVIRHVRGLMLRRALSVERPGAAEEIGVIADASRDRADAVLRFCRQVLAPAFEAVAGVPFVILATVVNGVTICIGNANLPESEDPVYKTLQGLVHGEANRTHPFVFDSAKLGGMDNAQAWSIAERFRDTAFLPLSSGRGFTLSVGFLDGDAGQNPLRENALELCKVLGGYLRPAVVEHLLTVLTQLGVSAIQRRREVLRATARLCLFIGQEQLDVLSDAEDSDEAPRGLHFRRLQSLAEDLRDTGEMLTSLTDDEDKETETTRATPPERTVSMSRLVSSAWEEIVRNQPKDQIAIDLDGDCKVLATREDLFIVASRLLQWLARRRVEASSEMPHLISVRCTETPDGPQVTLEDRSRRLPERLRRQLFFPFSQAVPLSVLEKDKGPGIHLPLYLAKMIVEVKYRGRLEDRSDEIEGDAGHRFVISFPKPDTLAK
ncbi:MAG: response regulator [Acidobacteriota bacterium]